MERFDKIFPEISIRNGFSRRRGIFQKGEPIGFMFRHKHGGELAIRNFYGNLFPGQPGKFGGEENPVLNDNALVMDDFGDLGHDVLLFGSLLRVASREEGVGFGSMSKNGPSMANAYIVSLLTCQVKSVNTFGCYLYFVGICRNRKYVVDKTRKTGKVTTGDGCRCSGCHLS